MRLYHQSIIVIDIKLFILCNSHPISIKINPKSCFTIFFTYLTHMSTVIFIYALQRIFFMFFDSFVTVLLSISKNTRTHTQFNIQNLIGRCSAHTLRYYWKTNFARAFQRSCLEKMNSLTKNENETAIECDPV